MVDHVSEFVSRPIRPFVSTMILCSIETAEHIVKLEQDCYRSDRPRYHANTRWTLPLLLASAALRRMPRRASTQLILKHAPTFDLDLTSTFKSSRARIMTHIHIHARNHIQRSKGRVETTRRVSWSQSLAEISTYKLQKFLHRHYAYKPHIVIMTVARL